MRRAPRRRVITIGGVEHRVSAERALQFEVVRGALTGAITIAQGAKRLRVPVREVARLVAGARRAVIAQLGRAALESARQAAAGS
ncbi:MAG: hypothetical protein ACM31C_25570 [Acidobacteriota bacterium]